MLLLYRRLELLVQKYCIPGSNYVSLLSFWCPYMVINVSVQYVCMVITYSRVWINRVRLQYNGGLLPDIILLLLCDSIGEPF